MGSISSTSVPSQKFEVLIEYSQTPRPGYFDGTPKLKVSYFRQGQTAPILVREHPNLPVGMAPIIQRQGLISQEGNMTGREFKVINCDAYIGCFDKPSATK